MKKEIFVVHSSEIIRRGLSATLRNYFHTGITQLSHIGDLDDFIHMQHASIIIFTEILQNKDLRPVWQLEKQNEVHLIGLYTDHDPDLSNYQHTLHLHTPGDEIHRLVSDLFASASVDHKENQQSGELSVREREVLKLVALGLSNKEIAERLFISIHTVISHRKNITEKLGIKSISGLTVYAILNKIIDPETIDPEKLI